MANQNRFRKVAGKTFIPVDKATVIEIGDMLFLSSGKAVPASSVTWNTDLATTQADLKNGFLGVAMQASTDQDEEPVLFMYDGVFEFVADSDSYTVGALIGAAKASGDALENQKIDDAVAAGAIGIVHEDAPASSTKVFARIRSQVMDGIKIGE